MISTVSHLSRPANAQTGVPASPQHLMDGSHRKLSLPHRLRSANRNSDRNPTLSTFVDRVRAHAPHSTPLRSALLQYVLTDRSLVEIADWNLCTISSIMYWAGKLKLPGRQRGRHALLAPTPDQKRVIRLFREFGAAEAARRSAKSRQRIYQIIGRWAPELMTQRTLYNNRRTPWPERRVPRCNVIAFRITADELRRLLAATPTSSAARFSANAKARAIVLAHITPPTDIGPEPPEASASSAAGTTTVAGSRLDGQKSTQMERCASVS